MITSEFSFKNTKYRALVNSPLKLDAFETEETWKQFSANDRFQFHIAPAFASASGFFMYEPLSLRASFTWRIHFSASVTKRSSQVKFRRNVKSSCTHLSALEAVDRRNHEVSISHIPIPFSMETRMDSLRITIVLGLLCHSRVSHRSFYLIFFFLFSSICSRRRSPFTANDIPWICKAGAVELARNQGVELSSGKTFH